MAGRAGVIDLRDLSSRYAWLELHVSKLIAAARLEPRGPSTHRFAPPEVVVAIVPFEEMELVQRSRVWLEDARAVLIVRTHDVPLHDAELRDYVEVSWRELKASFAVEFELHDWRSDSDLAAILAHATDLSTRQPAAPARRAAAAPVTLSSGPRFEVVLQKYTDTFHLARALSAGLRLAKQSAILETESDSLDLATRRTPLQQDRFGYGSAVLPDGRRIASKRERERTDNWLLGAQPFTAYGDIAMGFDPYHPVGWTGHRMFPYWLYRGERGVGFLSASDHDFPCGPSKKLYGYADNDPARVELAADASFVAYTFEHDVLVTGALPVAWRNAGQIDVADFQRDPERTVLFVHEAPNAFTSDLLDEDARDAAPVVVLGPSDDARYAVDLSRPTFRIASAGPGEGRPVTLGDPAPCFAVYDREHRRRRRGSGRLLGGAACYGLILDEGRYYREHLESGQRTLLGNLEGQPLWAAPVPGTVNVVLVTAEDDRRFFQLV